MTHRTAIRRVSMTGWQLQIPVPRDPAADERDDLTADITGSPAFPHIVEYLTHAKDLGMDPAAPSVIRRAIKAGNEAYAEELSRLSHQASYSALKVGIEQKHPDLVYYMRSEGLVKIGFTSNLKERKSSINPDGVMVVEPGGRYYEDLRHEQFARLRRRGEWFHLRDELVAHIFDLRAQFAAELGCGFEEWLAEYLRPKSSRKSGWRRRLPDGVETDPATGLPLAAVGEHPELGSLVTAQLGALAAGTTAVNVGHWKDGGAIQAVAVARSGARLYRLSDMIRIAGQRRTWRARSNP